MSLVDFGKRLLESAKLGETEEVRLLMTNGAPFTTDWLGTSPLHMAAEHGHVATAEVLLRAGISRDARTKVDRTPLHVASQEGHAEIVELLIKHGAEINAKDMLQMTPLHWAVERGHVPVVSCLLKYNADVHAPSKFDKTAMDIAEDNGRTDILKMLQEHIDSSDEKNKEKKPLTTVVPKTPLILPKTDTVPFNIVKTDTVTSPFVKEIRSKIARTHNTNSVTSITISDAVSSAKASVSPPVLLQANFGDLKSNISKSTGDTKSSSSDSDEGDSSDPSCTNVLATLAALAEATAPNATISTQEALHWLEMHGITMLPSDNSTIVASALEGGQTVSLTEAGKLALTFVKEHRNLNNGSSPEVSTAEEGGSFYSALQTKAGTSNQLITIVTDKSQIPSIITAQQPPIFVVSGQGSDVTGDEESPPAKKIKTLFSKQEISAVANGKISAEEERLLLQKELEKIKRQAAEYKAQLLLKEHEAEEYRKQLEQLKNTSGNNNL